MASLVLLRHDQDLEALAAEVRARVPVEVAQAGTAAAIAVAISPDIGEVNLLGHNSAQ